MLDLGRMLGRGVDHDVAILARQGEGDLTLEIEVLLSAHAELGAEPMRRALQGAVGIAAQQGRRCLHIGLLGERRLDIEDGLAGFDVDHRALGGVARRIECLGHHHGQRLAGIVDLLESKQRFVLADWCDVVLAGNVPGAKHRDHPRRGRDGCKVELAQPPRSNRAEDQRAMQRASGFGHVVDIECLPGDVLQGAVVAARAMDAHSASTSTARATYPWTNSSSTIARPRWRPTR